MTLKAESESYTIDVDGTRSMRKGQWVKERFCFADLKTSDDLTTTTSVTGLKDLGTITIRVYRVLVVSRDKAGAQERRTLHDPTGVPKKAPKGRALSACAALSEPAPCDTTRYQIKVSYLDGKVPFATFIFKYRSRRDLQIEGLIPRSASPVPLEERDRASLTREEAFELLQRQEQRQPVKQEMKARKRDHATLIEGDETDNDGSRVSFVSDSSKRPRTFRDDGVEIVDLCDD